MAKKIDTYDNFEDFLYDYFRQLHLNEMPSEKKAKLEELREDKKLTGAQDKWKPDADPLPDISQITSAAEIEKLYRKILSALRGMDGNLTDIKRKDPKVADQLGLFFGKDKPFSQPLISDETKEYIKAFVKDMEADEEVSLYVVNNSFESFAAYKKFITNIKEEKIDGDVISTLESIFRRLTSESKYGETLTKEGKSKAEDFLFNLHNIIQAFDPAREPLSSFKIEMFKRPEILRQVLGAIYDDKFRGHFGSNDITAELDKAKENTDYGKLSSKMDDKLTRWQSFNKWVKDKADGTIGKLADRHKSHNYLTNGAKSIVEAIQKKAEFEPTMGLGKVLEKDAAEKIKDAIAENNPSAVGAWDVFTNVMGKIQGGMEKAFAGCLKNGSQMRAVVQQVIATCLENGKFDEAKVILETLSVLRYGGLTTDKWKEWKGNKIHMWDGVDGMKSGFLKWFAVGTDFMVNQGVNALFWAGTAAVNKWNLRNSKFLNGEDLGALEKPLKQYYKTRGDKGAGAFRKDLRKAGREFDDDARNIAGEALEDAEKEASLTVPAYDASKDAEKKARDNRDDAEKNLADEEHRREVDAKNIKAKKSEMESAEKKMKAAEQEKKWADDKYKFSGEPEDYKEWEQKAKEYDDALAEYEWSKMYYNVENDEEAYQAAQNNLAAAQDEYVDAKDALDRDKAAYDAAAAPASSYDRLLEDLTERRGKVADGSAEANELDKKIGALNKKFAFDAAEQNLENKKKSIKRGEKTKYYKAVELMAFWDFLQTGMVTDKNILVQHEDVQKDFDAAQKDSGDIRNFKPYERQYARQFRQQQRQAS